MFPKLLKPVYWVTVGFITLTGFAQMPIFKRYYIADIPGLGWLAEFYVTHAMHYLFAALLIGLASFAVVALLLQGKPRPRLTASGMLKAVLVGGLIASGSLMVVRNLPGIHFSDALIIGLDLTHLGLCMALLIASLVTAVRGVPWVREPGR